MELEHFHNDLKDFEVCETPRTKVNTSLLAVGVSPISLHALPQYSRSSAAKVKLAKFTQKFKSDLSTAYSINDLELDDSVDKTVHVGEWKAAELDRLHEAMKE